jgi:hypothetical protein
LAVRFIVNKAKLLVDQVEVFEILQYMSTTHPSEQSLDLNVFQEYGTVRFLSQQFHQVTMQCKPQNSVAQSNAVNDQYAIRCKFLKCFLNFRETLFTNHMIPLVTQDSTFSSSKGVRYVTINKAICVYEKTTETEAKVFECDQVEFEFSSKSGKFECS